MRTYLIWFWSLFVKQTKGRHAGLRFVQGYLKVIFKAAG